MKLEELKEEAYPKAKVELCWSEEEARLWAYKAGDKAGVGAGGKGRPIARLERGYEWRTYLYGFVRPERAERCSG